MSNDNLHALSAVEKLGYSLGDLAANLIFQTLVSFLVFFYIAVYGIPADTAAAVIFVVGLFGAFVFTPLSGLIADCTRTRWGKFRPWLLWTAIAFGVLALLAFATPRLGENGKVAYALLMLAYISNNLPYSALSGAFGGTLVVATLCLLSFAMYSPRSVGLVIATYRQAKTRIEREPADDEPARGPRIARLNDDMKQFAEPPRAGDHARRYFEGPWLHPYRGRYYLSYSTGNTHLLCYATAGSVYGPYAWQGVILSLVVGWTTHHSIVAFQGKWWLCYHDSLLSGGITHLRSIKAAELNYDEGGRIHTLHPYGN